MIAELQQAHANRVKLDPNYLEMFIHVGSAKVKRKMADLIEANSTATSYLTGDALFALLLQQVRVSIDQVDSETFRDSCDLFLIKLCGYTLSDDLRRKTIQGFIDTISPSIVSGILSSSAKDYVMKRLLRMFPDVLRDKELRFSSPFRDRLLETLHQYDAYR